MRKVAAMCQIQTEECIPWVKNCQEYGCICLCSRVRLDICPFSIEDLFQPFDSNRFALVYYLATTIITLAGITFGVFVGQAASHGLHHLVAHKVFRSNQLDTFQLALMFFFNDVENDFVSFHYL